MSIPFTRLGAVLASALFLAACSTPHTSPKPPSSRIAASVVPDSVLRIGDEVSLALENGAFVLNYSASCKGDHPEIALDPPYQAPYGRKAERFRLSCADQKYSLLGGYHLDARDHVTDGAIFVRAAQERVDAANSDYRKLFAAVCGSPAELKALPTFVPREKTPLPTAATTPTPADSVFQAIDQLKLEPARRKQNLLVLEGTHVFEGKREPIREVRKIRAGAKPGLVSENQGTDGYEVDELSFMGWVNIQRETRFTKLKQQGNEAATELEFKGDWKRMPLGTVVSYTTASRSFYDSLGTLSRKDTTDCNVTRDTPAAQLHPALKGNAKLLECRVVGDQHHQVIQLHYRQDYSYLVSLESSETKFSSYSRRIVQVEQN